VKSKTSHVQEALKANKDIEIVEIQESNYLPGKNGFSHTFDIYVAPKQGIYDAEKLQALMEALVPDLEPTMSDRFWESDSQMSFGKLYFDETIGTEHTRREITLTDAGLQSTEGFVEGKKVIESTQDLRRRTWVRLYPNVQIAAFAVDGQDQWSIDKKDLIKYQGTFTRLMNRFFAKRK